MLYEIAHVIKDEFGFLWDAIEWANAELFALMHQRDMEMIPEMLKSCSVRYRLRLATVADIRLLEEFFSAQPEDAFRFFKPYGFDEDGIRNVLINKSFMTFVAMDGDRIAGYFFMRSFVNGKTFKGYMVGIDHRGKGVATEMGLAMNRVAGGLGLRMYKSISPDNPASLAVTKKVNDIKIMKTLDNGDMLIECFDKAGNQRMGGDKFFLIEIEIKESKGLHVESYKYAA